MRAHFHFSPHKGHRPTPIPRLVLRRPQQRCVVLFKRENRTRVGLATHARGLCQLLDFAAACITDQLVYRLLMLVSGLGWIYVSFLTSLDVPTAGYI